MAASCGAGCPQVATAAPAPSHLAGCVWAAGSAGRHQKRALLQTSPGSAGLRTALSCGATRARTPGAKTQRESAPGQPVTAAGGGGAAAAKREPNEDRSTATRWRGQCQVCLAAASIVCCLLLPELIELTSRRRLRLRRAPPSLDARATRPSSAQVHCPGRIWRSPLLAPLSLPSPCAHSHRAGSGSERACRKTPHGVPSESPLPAHLHAPLLTHTQRWPMRQLRLPARLPAVP